MTKKYLLIATLAVAGLANSLNAMEQRPSMWQRGVQRVKNWLDVPDYKTRRDQWRQNFDLTNVLEHREKEKFASQRQLILNSLENNPQFQALTEPQQAAVLDNIPMTSRIDLLYGKPDRDERQRELMHRWLYYPRAQKRYGRYGMSWDDIHNVPYQPYEYKGWKHEPSYR